MKEGGTQNTGSEHIRFRCKYCGQKIKIAKKHAGKKGKCPACKKTLIVPTPEINQTPSEKENHTPQSRSGDPLSDIQFLDLPKKKNSEPPLSVEPLPEETASEKPQAGEQIFPTRLPEQPGAVEKRSLPAIIDIFLYPLNKSGLTVLAVIFGSLLLLSALQFITAIFTAAFLPLLVISFFVFFGGFFVKIVLLMYLFWYFCQCVRDSAEGGIRAPETVAITPGIGELLQLTLMIIGCIVLLQLPAFVYRYFYHRYDVLFWSLIALGVFLIPMGLLSVILFNSISGFNPLLIIGSILRTFFGYIGLIICIVLFSLVSAGLLFALGFILTFSTLFAFGGALVFLPGFIISYTLLITGHLLGRFYWRYEGKLNWGI